MRSRLFGNPSNGGHAIISGGNVPLGGGTSVQKKYGIADSPDLLFRDLTDWSVVGPNGFPDYRYNDREIIRAFTDTAPLFRIPFLRWASCSMTLIALSRVRRPVHSGGWVGPRQDLACCDCCASCPVLR
jgi:hypothetical protein